MELYNGDCIEVIKELIEKGVKVDCVICDPPYKVISGGETKKGDKFVGVLSKNDGKIFKHNNLKEEDWFPKIYEILKPGSHCYIMTNTINLERYLRLARETGFGLHNLLIWQKSNRTLNKWYMKNCEYVLFLRKGKAKKINNISCNTVHKFNNVAKKVHPTEKPVKLMEMYIENSTNKNDIVLDFAMGSGSTGVACKNTGRNFIGIEIDENYFRIAKDRIENSAKQLKINIWE